MRRCALLLVVVAMFATSARACLWDYDTLRDERRGLPGVAEILAGRFERHSAFFYEDRVRRMTELLAREPANLDAWDNLAVAQAKLGRLDEAIATIKKKEAIAPDQYKTHSNLGTFAMFAGDYAAAIVELRRALEINPNAHFGREKYQVMLAEYLLAGQRDPKVYAHASFAWPVAAARFARPTTAATTTFAIIDEDPTDFYLFQRGLSAIDRQPIDAAIAGIVGMVRFGTDSNPHLYAALGDLLASRGDWHLAYRAFARARDAGYPSKDWVEERLIACRESIGDTRGDDDASIAGERARATVWVDAFQRFENDAIRGGRDPDEATLLLRFYAEHGSAIEPLGVPGPRDLWSKMKTSPPMTVAIVVLLTAAGIIAKRQITGIVRRRRHRASADAAGLGCCVVASKTPSAPSW